MMNAGQIMEIGRTDERLDEPREERTRGFLSTVLQ